MSCPLHSHLWTYINSYKISINLLRSHIEELSFEVDYLHSLLDNPNLSNITRLFYQKIILQRGETLNRFKRRLNHHRQNISRVCS